MTAVAGAITLRVAVPDVWDHVELTVDASTTVADVKRRALERALQRSPAPADEYLVKYKGAEVTDETVTVGALGLRPHAALIVLPTRRRPVR